jgi:DNA-directed RNA polymerase subunit RPC12/RpoP
MSVTEQRVEVSCRSCGAEILFEPLQRTARCPYCDSPSVVDRPARPDRPDPVFGLGFTVTADEATRRLQAWIAGQRMAPFGLKKRTAEKVKGVYLPTYLYSATAHTTYDASIAESYEDDDKEKQTEYRPLYGRHTTYVADVLVTASRGIPNTEIEGVESFELGALRRYTPALVSGWISEEPSLTQEECRDLARKEARAHVEKLLRDFMPGDGVRSLRHETSLDDESIDLTLVPVWVSAIRYDEKKPPLRLLVNGQTGRVYGRVPFSWAKLGLIVAGILGLVGLGRLLWWLLQ